MEVSELSATGIITAEELQAAYAAGKTPEVQSRFAKADESLFKHLSVAEVLYYIGGFIVFIGIVVLLAQNWESFNTVLKLLVTLGASLVAFVVGILFGSRENTKGLSQPFYMIAVLTLPVGVYQLLSGLGMKSEGVGVVTAVFSICSAFYLASFWMLRKIVFLLFGIFSLSILFFTVTDQLIGGNLAGEFQVNFYEYRLLILSLSYLLLGYAFDKTIVRALSGSLYALGIMGFLGAAYALQGWTPNQSLLWETLFPLFAFASMFLSTYLRRKTLLIFGAIGIMAYVIKITGQYFSEGLGWPFALVIAGLAFIGVGYFTYYLNKKYFNHATAVPMPPVVPPVFPTA